MGPSSGSVDAGFSSRRLWPRRRALSAPSPQSLLRGRVPPRAGGRQTRPGRRAPRRPDAIPPPESPCRTPLRPAASEEVGTGPVEVGGHLHWASVVVRASLGLLDV